MQRAAQVRDVQMVLASRPWVLLLALRQVLMLQSLRHEVLVLAQALLQRVLAELLAQALLQLSLAELLAVLLQLVLAELLA